MNEIVIYVEGGGDTAQQKAELRTGFDRLLERQKQAARAKRLRWRLVPSGGRSTAYRDFVNAVKRSHPEMLCVLLVDSEEGLPPEQPINFNDSPEINQQRQQDNAHVRSQFLSARDGWDLSFVNPECVHLMVRCMETWIVADPDGMSRVYTKNFHPNRLPARLNLEDEPKADLYSSLARATRDTSKGEYSEMNHSKIKHASQLLEKIRAERVAIRCPRFATFTRWLSDRISEA